MKTVIIESEVCFRDGRVLGHCGWLASSRCAQSIFCPLGPLPPPAAGSTVTNSVLIAFTSSGFSSFNIQRPGALASRCRKPKLRSEFLLASGTAQTWKLRLASIARASFKSKAQNWTVAFQSWVELKRLDPAARLLQNPVLKRNPLFGSRSSGIVCGRTGIRGEIGLRKRIASGGRSRASRHAVRK